MKKVSILVGIASCAMALGFVSCSDDYGPIAAGKGTISPAVGLDTEVATSRASGPAISVSDLSLRLTSEDGQMCRTWDSVDDFDVNEEFTIGKYTMEAYYGDVEEEGFDAGAYYGSTQLTIQDGKSTSVELEATLANAMFKVAYTENFINYMTDWSATLTSSSGADHYFSGDEIRPLYVKPGSSILKVSVVQPNGKAADYTIGTYTLEAKKQYTVTIDVNEGQTGSATLNIAFSDALDEEDIIIDLSAEIHDAPAPEVTAEGFISGIDIAVVEGMSFDGTLKMSVIARGGLASVDLVTVSPSLIAAGWPAEINLLSATTDQQATLTSLGFSAIGLWKQPDQMAVLDFSNVVANINTDSGAGENTFTLSVTDKNGRTTKESTVLSISLEELALEIVGVVGSYVPGEDLSLTVGYNGAEFENNVTFEYYNERGTWSAMEIKSVSAPQSRAISDYTVTLGTVESVGDLIVRAKCRTKITDEYTITPIPFVLEVNSSEVFATQAVVNLKIYQEDFTSSMITNWAVNGTSVAATALSDTSVLVKGLTADASNTVVASCSDYSDSKSFTTETPKYLGTLGELEDWHSVVAPHSNTTFGAVNYRYYPWAEGDDDNAFWATRNELTTAASSGPTPNYVAYSGTQNVSGASGYAAEISTLGYGVGSTFIETSGGGVCKYTAAGMLFMGTHTASSETEETITYGRPWTVRPLGFNFKYKFTNYNSEYWKAYAVVESNGTQIGYGEVTSNTDVSDFTSCSVTINYSVYDMKATSMYIVFISSTADSPSVKNVKGSKGAFAGYTDARRIGNVLTVDQIELTY